MKKVKRETIERKEMSNREIMKILEEKDSEHHQVTHLYRKIELL